MFFQTSYSQCLDINPVCGTTTIPAFQVPDGIAFTATCKYGNFYTFEDTKYSQNGTVCFACGQADLIQVCTNDEYYAVMAWEYNPYVPYNGFISLGKTLPNAWTINGEFVSASTAQGPGSNYNGYGHPLCNDDTSQELGPNLNNKNYPIDIVKCQEEVLLQSDLDFSDLPGFNVCLEVELWNFDVNNTWPSQNSFQYQAQKRGSITISEYNQSADISSLVQNVSGAGLFVLRYYLVCCTSGDRLDRYIVPHVANQERMAYVDIINGAAEVSPMLEAKYPGTGCPFGTCTQNISPSGTPPGPTVENDAFNLLFDCDIDNPTQGAKFDLQIFEDIDCEGEFQLKGEETDMNYTEFIGLVPFDLFSGVPPIIKEGIEGCHCYRIKVKSYDECGNTYWNYYFKYGGNCPSGLSEFRSRFNEHNDEAINQNFIIYPNPNSGNVFKISSESEIVEMSCFDLSGNLIMTSSSQTEINLGTQKGVFFIHVSLKNGRMLTEKIIAQ